MNGNIILDWFKNLLTHSSDAIKFLTTPIAVGSWSVTPIELISITGLLAFIGVALVMWVVSSVS